MAGVPRLGNDGIKWIIDDKASYKALRLMNKNVKDFRKYWDAIIEAVLEDNAQRFASKDGGRWKPDSRRYLAWKAKHGGGSLMRLTGTLYSAMTEQNDYGQKITKGRQMLTMRFYGSAHHGARTNTAAEQRKRGRNVINANSPFLRKRMGDAAGKVAREWAREWEGGT